MEPFPKRARTALDSGAYVVNYRACSACGASAVGRGLGCLAIVNKKVEEEEDEETGDYEEVVEYDHASCPVRTRGGTALL